MILDYKEQILGLFQSCCSLSATATRWQQISFYFVQTVFTLVRCRFIVHLATAMGLDLGFKLFNFIITFSRVGYICYLVSGKLSSNSPCGLHTLLSTMTALECIQILRILESLKENLFPTTLIEFHCTEKNYSTFTPMFNSVTVSGYTSSIMKTSEVP